MSLPSASLAAGTVAANPLLQPRAGTAAPAEGGARLLTGPDVSVVMPCLNEEATIGACIAKAQQAFERLGVAGEVIVCDNGSSDRSVEIATELGARVVHERRKGYGSAYMRAIGEARSEYIVMGDSDDTYDFGDMERFLTPLREGFDLVMGSRFAGQILPGSMTWSHRYIGNPILSGILNLFFKVDISDAHCGMRSFTKAAYRKMGLQTTGMEFASEMVVNAGRAQLRIAEVPITYYPREGESKLETWRDGWRHLRFMLLYAPTWLFIIPGMALLLPGLAFLALLLPGTLRIGGHGLYEHSMILASLVSILGYQVLTLGLYARTYAMTAGFVRHDALLGGFYQRFTLEKGLLLGGAAFVAGLALNGWILLHWINSNFGTLDAVRPALFASTLMVVGVQTIFSSFFLSLLSIRPGPSERD
jgi:glycosyltransferase involved in cell wall biosynthesis